MTGSDRKEEHTLKHWLAYGVKALADAGVREPESDARILMEYAANINRSYYYLHMHDRMDPQDEELYAHLLRKRAAREPVQYLTKEAPFFGEMFYVTPQVLIPRQDTEILVEEAEKRIYPGMIVLELCTGSGCVLLSLARRHSVTAIGTDNSTAALAVAEQNRKRLGLRATWIESDLFEKVGGHFDLILSNPPYIPSAVIEELDPEVRAFEPRMALDGGPDGLDLIRRIIGEAGGYLRPEGWLLLEIGYDQGSAVCRLMEEAGFRETEIIQDLERRDRVVAGRK